MFYNVQLSISVIIDLARAKSEVHVNIYSLLKKKM